MRGDRGVGSGPSDENWYTFFQALAENERLVKLDLSRVPISDANWDTLCRSVSGHPNLENLIFNGSVRRRERLADAEKPRRTQVIIDALRVNTVLHTVELVDRLDCDFKIMDNMVRPRLLVNRYRPRVAAIAEERGIWQLELFGRALASVSGNLSLNPMWMMMSGNVNIICGNTPGE